VASHDAVDIGFLGRFEVQVQDLGKLSVEGSRSLCAQTWRTERLNASAPLATIRTPFDYGTYVATRRRRWRLRRRSLVRDPLTVARPCFPPGSIPKSHTSKSTISSWRAIPPRDDSLCQKTLRKTPGTRVKSKRFNPKSRQDR
jgi:hypothetical protein